MIRCWMHTSGNVLGPEPRRIVILVFVNAYLQPDIMVKKHEGVSQIPVLNAEEYSTLRPSKI